MAKSNKHRSISGAGTTEPFYLQVARGSVVGHVPVNANGYNAAVGTTEEAVWANGAAANWPASASVMQVSSGSANDAAAGTGARTVTVYGLNSDWDLAQETVTMNGQTEVATTTSFIRVFRAKCETFGSGDTNAGIIYVSTGGVTAGVPDTATSIFTTIPLGEGESLQALYSVPRNHTAYVLDLSLSAFVAADEYTTFTLEYREGADVATAGWTTLEKLDIASQFYLLYSCSPYIEEKSDIVINATAQTTSTRVGATFNLLVIKDSYDHEVT